jgi:uptake hydrogenase large subunit
VQNARCLLLHRAVLDKQGTIADYRLVAPTEWNFHPDGPYAQGLNDKPASTRAQVLHDAELLAHALDPCVAYQIEVDHA